MKKIGILGTGCPKCTQLADNADLAAKSLGIEYELNKITQINEIMAYGVMVTPALAIDGKVVSAGKALSVDEIKEMIG